MASSVSVPGFPDTHLSVRAAGMGFPDTHLSIRGGIQVADNDHEVRSGKWVSEPVLNLSSQLHHYGS